MSNNSKKSYAFLPQEGGLANEILDLGTIGYVSFHPDGRSGTEDEPMNQGAPRPETAPILRAVPYATKCVGCLLEGDHRQVFTQAANAGGLAEVMRTFRRLKPEWEIRATESELRLDDESILLTSIFASFFK